MYSLTNECKCIHMCAHTHLFTPYKAAGSVEKKKGEKKSISLPQVIKLSLQSQPETSI